MAVGLTEASTAEDPGRWRLLVPRRRWDSDMHHDTLVLSMLPLDDLIRKARLRLLRMHYEAGVGHIGGNLSALDAMLLVHDLLRADPETRPELSCVIELPVEACPPPEEFVGRLLTVGWLCVAEEHVAQGGLGAMLAQWLLVRGIRVGRFHHAYARGYPSRTFGSQSYHRRESGLSAAAIFDGMQEGKA